MLEVDSVAKEKIFRAGPASTTWIASWTSPPYWLLVIVWLICGSMLFLLKFMHDELIALLMDIAGTASSSSSSIALSLLPVIMKSCLWLYRPPLGTSLLGEYISGSHLSRYSLWYSSSSSYYCYSRLLSLIIRYYGYSRSSLTKPDSSGAFSQPSSRSRGKSSWWFRASKNLDFRFVVVWEPFLHWSSGLMKSSMGIRQPLSGGSKSSLRVGVLCFLAGEFLSLFLKNFRSAWGDSMVLSMKWEQTFSASISYNYFWLILSRISWSCFLADSVRLISEKEKFIACSLDLL